MGKVATELFDDAQELLKKIVDGRQLTAKVVYGFWAANSVGDDIVLYKDHASKLEIARFHMLRQQWQRQGQTDYRSLADYVISRMGFKITISDAR